MTDENTRASLQPSVVEAAKDVVANKMGTYKARNGRHVSIEADDGEMCWIVHSDDMFQLEAALAAPPRDDVREALEPVLHWYQSDEEHERPAAEIVRDVVADLKADRASNLATQRALRMADQLSVFAQTTGGTAGTDEGLVEAIEAYSDARREVARIDTALSQTDEQPGPCEMSDEEWEKVKAKAPKPNGPLTPIEQPDTQGTDGLADWREVSFMQLWSNYCDLKGELANIREATRADRKAVQGRLTSKGKDRWGWRACFAFDTREDRDAAIRALAEREGK